MSKMLYGMTVLFSRLTCLSCVCNLLNLHDVPCASIEPTIPELSRKFRLTSIRPPVLRCRSNIAAISRLPALHPRLKRGQVCRSREAAPTNAPISCPSARRAAAERTACRSHERNFPKRSMTLSIEATKLLVRHIIAGERLSDVDSIGFGSNPTATTCADHRNRA